MAMLEDEDCDGVTDVARKKERATIEETIAATDRAIAEKERELAEARANGGGVSADLEEHQARLAAFDADEAIVAEREKLAQLQAEWEEKLRAAELEIDQADQEAGDRQEEQQPRILEPQQGRPCCGRRAAGRLRVSRGQSGSPRDPDAARSPAGPAAGPPVTPIRPNPPMITPPVTRPVTRGGTARGRPVTGRGSLVSDGRRTVAGGRVRAAAAPLCGRGRVTCSPVAELHGPDEARLAGSLILAESPSAASAALLGPPSQFVPQGAAGSKCVAARRARRLLGPPQGWPGRPRRPKSSRGA